MKKKMINDELKQKELIQKYVSGDFSKDEKSTIERMLRDDPDLATYIKKSEQVWDLLSATEDIEPNPNYISNFWSKVREEQENRSGLRKLLDINIRWVFVSSFVTVLLVSAILLNIFIVEEPPGTKFVFDEQDEILLKNLDKAITKKTAASLEVFGPWEK